MPLYREGTSEALIVDDPWLRLTDDAAVPADGMVLVSFARWREARAALLARRGPVGVALANTDPVEALAPDVSRLDLVTLHFPKFSDGRAYSQARLLRGRFGYQGELLSDTRGTAIMNRIFHEYAPHKGEIKGRHTGVLISNGTGTAVSGVSFATPLQTATDARFKVNGLEVTRSSNTVTDVIDGVTLDLLVAPLAAALGAGPARAAAETHIDFVRETLAQSLRSAARRESAARRLNSEFSPSDSSTS